MCDKSELDKGWWSYLCVAASLEASSALLWDMVVSMLSYFNAPPLFSKNINIL